MMGKIYALICPITSNIRYIGQTIRPLNRRLSSHKSNKKSTYVANWFKKLDVLELMSDIKIITIEDCNDYLLNDREIYWISYYKSVGCDLLNLTDGGNQYSLNSESIEKIRVANLGRIVSIETRQKQSKKRKGIKRDESFCLSIKNSWTNERKELQSNLYLAENNPFYSKKHTKYSKKLISDKAKLRTGNRNSFYNKKHSEETKQILREKSSILKKQLVLSDMTNNHIFKTKLEVVEFFEKNGILLNSKSLFPYISRHVIPKKVLYKGYYWNYI